MSTTEFKFNYPTGWAKGIDLDSLRASSDEHLRAVLESAVRDGMTVADRDVFVHRTGRKNQLGDELIVMSGYADWGQAGWFTAEEITSTGPHKGSRSPKCFFHTREGAIADLKSDYYAEYK